MTWSGGRKQGVLGDAAEAGGVKATAPVSGGRLVPAAGQHAVAIRTGLVGGLHFVRLPDASTVLNRRQTERDS